MNACVKVEEAKKCETKILVAVLRVLVLLQLSVTIISRDCKLLAWWGAVTFLWHFIYCHLQWQLSLIEILMEKILTNC